MSYGNLVRDKRSGDLYIFCGTATEEDYNKYAPHNPFRELQEEPDFLLWSNKKHGFVFIAQSVAHLYIEPVELDKHTISVTENNSDAQN